MQKYVIRNTREIPVRAEYPQAGQVLPYISLDVDGEPVAAEFTEDEARRFASSLGEPVPVPSGLRTVRHPDL